jgi:hypothetical protein
MIFSFHTNKVGVGVRVRVRVRRKLLFGPQ